MNAKPSPHVTLINEPFLRGCNRNEFWLQRCALPTCRKFVFYPRVCCHHCGAGTLTWERATGRGQIVSFSLVSRPQHESFFPEAPFYFIAVRLEEGPLFFSRLDHPDILTEINLIGREVRTLFVQHTPEQRLPHFQLS
jgi:uncharacterized OB-fold protein